MDIKICGLKTEEALAAATSGGASHAGFIFFADSPRYVPPVRAGQLALRARAHGLKTVAVTVDADDRLLSKIVEGVQPDILQLHGKETPERVAEIKARFGLPVMKALPIRDKGDLKRIAAYRGVADRLLFDAKPAEGALLPGGNGVPFDWRLIDGIDPDVDYMLSGGLNAENIAAALKLLHPRGIDVSSGVESAPGVKEPALIERFFQSVREAADQTAA
jgi:phosphoribosylanthranilate isomerase